MIPFPPHIFACTDLYSWDAASLTRGTALLPPGMQADILRYRRHEDRCRSLAGKLLLRYGLRQLSFSTDFSDWQQTATHGRPFLPRRPVFSISHTGPVALCGIDEAVVGVDAEMVRDLPIEDFKQVFTVEETNAIREDPNPLALFYTLWTRKEAVLKAMGTGLLHPPDAINVLTSPVRLEDRSFHLHPLPIGQHFIAHAALESDRAPGYRIVSGHTLLEQA